MNKTIQPGPRMGKINIIASKSCAHRLIILSALGKKSTDIICSSDSADIQATIRCMDSLGASISRSGDIIHIDPIKSLSSATCELDCGESGSTLRFLLPIIGALGTEAVFIMHGRLGQRPLAPLDSVLRAHGMNILQQENKLYCSGKLNAGEYEIAGNVSSQYISGLLMALPLLEGSSTLKITGKLESAAYVDITLSALRLAKAAVKAGSERDYTITGGNGFELPASCIAEGDWSNAAFFLCMGALSRQGITVCGLDKGSCQGDKKIIDILKEMGASISIDADNITVKANALRPTIIDAAPIPDLIPALCALAAAVQGDTQIINAARLRLKESDRLTATANMLNTLGGNVKEAADGLIISGTGALEGGSIDSCNDHRIAMAAAVAAALSKNAVTIRGSECVNKSYPNFFNELNKLKAEGANA